MLPQEWSLGLPGFHLKHSPKKLFFFLKGFTTMTLMPGFAHKSSSLVCSRANWRRCRWPRNPDHIRPSFWSRQPPRRWWRAEAPSWAQAEPSARTWGVFWTSLQRRRGGRWWKVSLKTKRKVWKNNYSSETAPPWRGEASPVSGEGCPTAGECFKVSLSLCLAPIQWMSWN